MHYQNKLYKNILIILLLLLANGTTYANKFTLVSVGDILIPIPINTSSPTIKVKTKNINIIRPNKPVFTTTPKATTHEDQVSIEIKGSRGNTILVNGHYVGIIPTSGKKIITLDTSRGAGRKVFRIILKDHANNVSAPLTFSILKTNNIDFNDEYKGLHLYHKKMEKPQYQLTQISDDSFNALTSSQKLQVSNTLLSTLFFGYPQKELLQKINSGHFVSMIYQGLQSDRTDKGWIEKYIHNDTKFKQLQKFEKNQVNILSRFYAMQELDSYFLKNWVAYILTQNIMFSPASELDSTHYSDISNIYNRIVTSQENEQSMRYMTYVHMKSQENWRRFRSPEDNSREMLEIFHFDMDDRHVSLSAKALKNWKLKIYSGDTLEIGPDENTEPIKLFGTIIKNGDDFYRELVKSPLFITSVTKRLVQCFFPNKSEQEKIQITTKITSSNPETWQDILLQIVFSEEYLLHNKRAKSLEEHFFSLTKKMNFKHMQYTLFHLKVALTNAHQATMKYKLGKNNHVPLDTLSFAYIHKYIREELCMRRTYKENIKDYTAWSRHGWDSSFVSLENFKLNEKDTISSLNSFINYIFETIIYRKANAQELSFFKEHMTYIYQGKLIFRWAFDMHAKYNNMQEEKEGRTRKRMQIAIVVLDYLSRLETLYLQKEVK